MYRGLRSGLRGRLRKFMKNFVFRFVVSFFDFRFVSGEVYCINTPPGLSRILVDEYGKILPRKGNAPFNSN